MSHIVYQARRSARSALLFAALLGLPACGSDGPTTPKQGGKVTGTYVLEEIGEDALPVPIHTGAYLDPATGIFYNSFLFEVLEGYIEVREDETFYMSFDWRLTADGQVVTGTNDAEGVWDELPEGVRLRFQFPFTGTATLERRDDGTGVHTDMDLGFGKYEHLDFNLFKR